jgi:hypothetical protein
MNPGPEHDDHFGPDDPEPFGTRRDLPWHRPRLAGVLAVAAIALAGGAGVTYAATHTGGRVLTASSAGGPQASAATPAPAKSPPAGRGHFGPGRMGGFGGLGFGLGGFGVIHGQVTEPKAGGGYQTIDVQRGTVTAVSTSSITVKSADGYTATYAVSSSTEVNAQAAGISTVKNGDTVELTATVSGSSPTAASIIDLTSIQSSRGSFGFPGPGASKPS